MNLEEASERISVLERQVETLRSEVDDLEVEKEELYSEQELSDHACEAAEEARDELENAQRVKSYEAGDWLGPLLDALALEGVEVTELVARTPPHSRERRELVDALVHRLDRAGFKIVRNDR